MTSSLPVPALASASSTSAPSSRRTSLAPADEMAEEINLPTRGNSLDGTPHNVEGMTAIDASHRVPKTSTVVRDKKSGQHYVKHKHPHTQQSGAAAFSLAKAKDAPKVEDSPQWSASIGLAHRFGTSVAGSRRGSRDSGIHVAPSSAMSAGQGSVAAAAAAPVVSMDPQTAVLVEHLRAIIKEEVQSANKGHQVHVERAANAAEEAAQALQELDLDNVGNDSDETVQNSVEKDEKEWAGEGGYITRDAGRAERGDIECQGEDDEEDEFPNPWARLRYHIREPLAEALGTFILMTFGDGINNQVVLSGLVDATDQKGSYLSISFGWGIAVAMGVWVAGGISGAHLNPSVTIALATWRGFPWRKVGPYIIGQMIGAFLGALCIWGLYANPINMVDPGKTELTASLFTTYPASFIRTASTRLSGFYNEVYATAVLLIVIAAIGDSNNTPPPSGSAPLTLLWLVTGIGATLGWQTAYAVNPARDLGPRIMLWMVGYGSTVWTFDAWYWAYTPLLGSLVGAQLGMFMYDLLIYDGGESPLNRPWSFGRRFGRVRWTRGSSRKMPAHAEVESS